MNLLTIAKRFPTQEACIAHLEQLRWGDDPRCPFCNSNDVARKTEHKHVGRWNCHNCLSTFKVLSGTIFQGTKIPLQKWFAAIAILINAKKSVSSCQLARDLDCNQKSAWYMAMRIRKAMVDDSTFLSGIVEADETYIGGKPRKNNEQRSRGRTKKITVVGAVERDGKVKAQPSPRVTARLINAFLRRNVDPRAVLMTDQFPGYNEVRDWMVHKTVNHSIHYVDGITHTNTIEGFWSLVKRAIAGQHHHYTVEHAHAYIDEATYKYNIRKAEMPWDDFMAQAMAVA